MALKKWTWGRQTRAIFFFSLFCKKKIKKNKKNRKKTKNKKIKNRKKWLFRRGFSDQRVAGVLSQRKRTRTRKRKKKEKKKGKKKKKKRKRKNDKPDILFVTPLWIDEEKRRRKKREEEKKTNHEFLLKRDRGKVF